MNFYEQPTNTAGRGSNGPERSRWRDQGVDPELVGNPYDMEVGTDVAPRPVAERVSLERTLVPTQALQEVQLDLQAN